MLYVKCIELKKMIARYNSQQYREENKLSYSFEMFQIGDWSCMISCDGVVHVRKFRDIFDFVSNFYVQPFMWGSECGFHLHIQ